MKILNISSLYPPNVVGGAEQGLKTMSEAMTGLGHEVHIVTLAGPNTNALAPSVEPQVNVHHVPLANIYWPFNGARRSRSLAEKLIWHSIDTANEIMARRVRRIVQQVKPDVVLTRNLQGFSTAVIPAIKRTGVPLVHVLHDYSLLCPQTTLYRNNQACGTGSQRCTRCRVLTAPRHMHLNSVDGVIGVSQAVLEMHRQHGLFPECPATVIYNALKPSIAIQREPRAQQPGQPFTFGYMGRVERLKGIETLLEAAQRLEQLGLNFRILVAGRAEPVYLETLRQCWPLKSVEYVGYVEAAAFLRKLDSFVFPTEWLEALGNGVFEAFSQGVPVIGSNAGGIPESIEQGVTGFVFEGGNVVQLADRMVKLVCNPKLQQKMAAAALDKARQYQPPKRAQEYIDFLTRIINQRGMVDAV